MPHINVTYTRPSTTVGWPHDYHWLDSATKQEYQTVTDNYVNSGLVTERTITESQDGLSCNVVTRFRDMAAMDAWLYNTKLQEARSHIADFNVQSGCTKTVELNPDS